MMTIVSSAGYPHEAGDVLTCVARGDNATYEWSGTNGGRSFTASSSTVTLYEGEFCLVCTATVNSDPKCSSSDFRCDTAYRKYQKQQSTLVTYYMNKTANNIFNLV